jgi:hypothetical protein
MLYIRGSGSMESSDTFMSNFNCQGTENQCWAGLGGNNIEYNQTQNIIFSVVLQFVWLHHLQIHAIINNLWPFTAPNSPISVGSH